MTAGPSQSGDSSGNCFEEFLVAAEDSIESLTQKQKSLIEILTTLKTELQNVLKEDGSVDVLDNRTEKLINKLEHRMEALQQRLTRINETLNEIESIIKKRRKQ